MLLNSFDFICIIPVVIAVYYLAAKTVFSRSTRLSNILLLLVSYAFYVTAVPAHTLILIGVTVVAYVFGRLIDSDRIKRKQLAVTAGVCLALVPLLTFKYYNFILLNAGRVFSLFGVETNFASTSWIIPLGISFFTFQALGYLFDVYRGTERAEKNFLDFALFVSFFPQIASGPISRAGELLPQIKSRREFRPEMFSSGLKLLLWGYFLKAVFADRLATYVNVVYADYNVFSGWSNFMASILYSLQIYGDFAGYSLMAIGVGRLFGFDIVQNFRRPYFSESITEFWRRWHISLSRWLRDYVYIGLGGNRRGKLRTYWNIIVTFAVSGIWHGASLTFVAWGLIHGLVQCVEKLFRWNMPAERRLVKALKIAATFLVVNFAWIFFRMPSFKAAFGVIRRILTMAPGESVPVTNANLFYMVFAVAVVLLKEIAEETRPGLSVFNNRRIWVRWTGYLIVLFSILLFGVLDSSSFIYVNF